VRNVITGFLGAILVTLAFQVITPPNLTLTSKRDPSSLTGRIVWNTRFELGMIGVGFLVGAVLGNLQVSSRERRPREQASTPRPGEPGWYTDPLDGSRLRRWDGARWTDDSSDISSASPSRDQVESSPS
jgi:hypothetical protein